MSPEMSAWDWAGNSPPSTPLQNCCAMSQQAVSYSPKQLPQPLLDNEKGPGAIQAPHSHPVQCRHGFLMFFKNICLVLKTMSFLTAPQSCASACGGRVLKGEG